MNDPPPMCFLPTVSHWNQDGSSIEHKLVKDQALSPFLSISRSGRCSPRTDPSQAHPSEWLLRLDASHRGVSSLQNLQANGTSCSDPPDQVTGAETSFQPDFGSETSNEEDGSFPFLDQEPENHNSNHNPADSQDVGQRGARQIQPQGACTESTWRQRDERVGRGPSSNSRRVTPFGNRDPLRQQSNLQLVTVRHSNTFGTSAITAGSGRPYPCPYCSKSFTYPSHQRRHLLRHTGVRLHPCQFCEKSFLTPSELTVHTRTHTGERPFACSQCGKRFARSGNLRAHQRDVHMGKRPFACNECGKRFAHRGNLRVHNHRVHQGDPYYTDDQQDSDIVPNPI